MAIESSIESPAEPAGTAVPPGDASPLAAKPLLALGQALAQAGVRHCRLTGDLGLEGDDIGEHEIDLLVSRAHMGRLAGLLSRLGFKQAKAPAEKAVPGTLDSFAYDTEADRLIRVHAHHVLLLGNALTSNYRLPIEGPFMSSAAHDGTFRVPAPEHELIVFVLQVLLRYSTLDILWGRKEPAHAARRLAELQARAAPHRVREALDRDLPGLGAEVFESCLEALRPGSPRSKRVMARLQVLQKLRAHARRPLVMEIGLRLCRQAARAGRRHVLRRSSRYRLASGGAMIAIVGGDGAGKSTVVDGLSAWLSKDFATASVHLGKPGWSWITITVRGIVKVGQLLGLYPPESSFRETLAQASLRTTAPWLLREVCRARDRYAKYVVARRSATGGGLVISDRFPLPQIRLMDGPLAQRLLNALGEGRYGGRLARALVELEESYYRRFTAPEVLIVLRVDPEIAAERRAGEDLLAVRERSTEIWQVDWRHTNAHVIDAGKPKAEVLAEAKAFAWSEL